jgi:hypothetical protein
MLFNRIITEFCYKKENKKSTHYLCISTTLKQVEAVGYPVRKSNRMKRGYCVSCFVVCKANKRNKNPFGSKRG